MREFLLKDATVKSLFASICVKTRQRDFRFLYNIHKNVVLFCKGIFKGFLHDLDVYYELRCMISVVMFTLY